MEEPKECDLMMGLQLQERISRNHIQMEISNKNTKQQFHFYFVKFWPSPAQVKREEVDKLVRWMCVSMTCIHQEIRKLKEDERQINDKLLWYLRGDDKHIEWKTQKITNLEHSLGKVLPRLPLRWIPRTGGFLHLTEKDAEMPVVVGTDRKRCQNRLKKERMDFEYLEQVQEELLASKKSAGRTMGGTQELNDVMESLVHRTQHGNNNRANETKFFHEIRKIEETREKYMYTTPKELSLHDYWISRSVGPCQRQASRNKALQHKIKILLNDIKEIKRDRMGHTARVILLKEELEHVRKNIRCMEREEERVDSWRMKAFKCAHELQEQKEKLCFFDYESLMTYVQELVRKGDVVALRKLCDTQVKEFMRQWINSKVFRDDYERVLENVNAKRMDELGELTKEVVVSSKSSPSNYLSLRKYAKKLVQEGGVLALRKVCEKQFEGFMMQWNNVELILED